MMTRRLLSNIGRFGEVLTARLIFTRSGAQVGVKSGFALRNQIKKDP